MKLGYVATKNGKTFQKSITVPGIDAYYSFIREQNDRHDQRGTGFKFYSL